MRKASHLRCSTLAVCVKSTFYRQKRDLFVISATHSLGLLGTKAPPPANSKRNRLSKTKKTTRNPYLRSRIKLMDSFCVPNASFRINIRLRSVHLNSNSKKSSQNSGASLKVMCKHKTTFSSPNSQLLPLLISINCWVWPSTIRRIGKKSRKSWALSQEKKL